MDVWAYLLVGLTLAVFVQAQNLKSSCVISYDSTVDYFPVKSVVSFATDFSLTYSSNYKVLTNTFTSEVYVLYQCGTPQPAANLFSNVTKFFSVPVTRAWTLDTTSITFLEMLGLRQNISIISTEIDITSPCVLARYNAGLIADIESVNTTALETSGEDVAFGYSSANAPEVVDTDSEYDPGLENRVEWLKFYAAFFNFEDVANNLTSSLVKNIGCLRNLSIASTNPLTVAWASYYGGSWTLSPAAYKQQLTQYAGAVFGPTGTFTDLPSFFSAVKNVDILIDETYFVSLPTFAQVLASYNLTQANATPYKWVNNIFREDGLVTKDYGFDWYDGADVMSDAVLADMLNVVSPSLPSSIYQRIWLRNASSSEQPKVITASSCPSLSSTTLADSAPTCSPQQTTTTAATTSGTSSLGSACGLFWMASIASLLLAIAL